jgi:Cu(I)/Ag(I) efflux system membrane fusion protein
MKTFQKSWKRTTLAALLLLLIASVFTFYVTQHPAMSNTKRASPMQAMEGMERGVNETGQATTMLSSQKKQRIGVKVAQVEEKEAERVIKAVGRIAYDERKLAQITMKVDGWIQDLFVNFTGQEVKKGEPLFTLYSPDLLAMQQEYLLAKKSRKKLSASPISDVRETGEILLNATRQRLLLLGISEKQIEELEKRGEAQTYMTIHSPISGVVIKREGTQGMRVTPEKPLYEIADLSTVWVLAEVYESDLSSVKKGVEAAVRVAAYPGDLFRGRVTFISPSLNPQTRTAQVRIELPNPDLKLRPEMFADIEWASLLGRGLLIPDSAVLDSGVRQIVFVDQGMEMVVPREIKGRRIGGSYLVEEGVRSGEKIVISANFLIDAESKLMASADMMGALGMAGIRMEQAQMGEMEMSMDGIKMQTKEEKGASGPQMKKKGDLTLTLLTQPSPPAEGENLLRLVVTDAAGKPIDNAKVVFSYTMPMPGMKAVKVPASFKNGQYEAKAKFGMAGTWEVTALVTVSGKPEVQETFTLEAGGEMEGMEGMPGM